MFFSQPDGGGAYWETSITPVLSTDGAVDRLWAISRDVTREVESSAFLASVIQLLPFPITVKSIKDGRYILVNAAAEDLLSLSAEDLLGRTDYDLLPRGEADQLSAIESMAIATDERHISEEHVAGRPGEADRQFIVRRIATHGDAGPHHLIVLHQDVTEQRESAASLEAALLAAEEGSRAKSVFLANISHEFRTPLNGILAAADLLALRDLDPASLELADLVRSSASTLERLVCSVLNLSSVDRDDVLIRSAPFDVARMIEPLITEARKAAADKGVEIRVGDLTGLGRISGDEGRMAQVLGALIDNGVKFTDQGHVSIAVERLAGERLRFEVRDTGVGFDAAQKEHIFDRLHQGDGSSTRRFGGLGAGLTVAKAFAERMGGSLDCESVSGVGSSFWFEIPAPACSPQEPAQCGPTRETATAERRMRVLLADDHPANRKIVEIILGPIAEVISVEDGAQAVLAFREHSPDLVLMDMQMPVMDGLAATRAIRQFQGDGPGRAPIIMLTANALAEHVRASFEAGADMHIAKPVRAATLLEAIDGILQDMTARDATRAA